MFNDRMQQQRPRAGTIELIILLFIGAALTTVGQEALPGQWGSWAWLEAAVLVCIGWAVLAPNGRRTARWYFDHLR